MKHQNEWEAEIKFLAEHWQPLFVAEVVTYYHKRMKALHSPKAAFTDVYERFFLNPRPREVIQ